MPDNASSSGLNENHVRHVVTTFRYIDELLSKAEHIMAAAGAPSPFQEYADDTTPLQRKVTHDYVIRLREMMSRNLEELHIPRPAPVTRALWAARNAVTFANIALAEMESKQMRGYGKMSESAAQKIDAIVVELRSAVEKLDDYLAQGAGVDLQARLKRLEATSAEAALLRELERIITAHGLVEFRNAVVMLLERMEHGAFEIGVFGRVSSGKSSLLNHLLDGDYLPVGVTPVTAVPTRISFGPSPKVIVEFADHRPQTVELSALADFATEQQNPGNAKHVSRIRVELPAARLREGITFVDTPGLGSLATGGAEETVAYLPRCDLGLVLVDAASALTREDLKIIEALYRAGATAMVLVSKTDLLQPADRERAMAYVQQQIRAEINIETPVHPMSVVGADASLCDAWFASELRPLLDSHRELAAASLRRKIGGLREALLAALRRRVARTSSLPNRRIPFGTPSGDPATQKPSKSGGLEFHETAGLETCATDDAAQREEVERELRNVPLLLETTRREAEEQARRLRESADRVVEIVAGELAAAWLARDGRAVNPAALVSATVARLLAEESAQVRRRVEQTRGRLAELLLAAARAAAWPAAVLQDLPKPAGLPLSDVSGFASRLALRRPAMIALLGSKALRRQVRAQLREQAGSELDDLLRVFSQRLVDWVKQSFAELETAFSANAGMFQSQSFRRETSPATASDDGLLRNDLQLLERWGQPETRQLEPVT
jgi:GTP-binding protein EngB required for normal cell division